MPPPRHSIPRRIRRVPGLVVCRYPSLLRARRRHVKKDERDKTLYRRHLSMVEGVHGESKAQHGLHRAGRRGRWNVAIQSYLTAAMINLKRLAKALGYLRAWIERLADRLAEPCAPDDRLERLILHPLIHRFRCCPLAASPWGCSTGPR